MDRTGSLTHSSLDSNTPDSQVTPATILGRDLLSEAETGLTWLRRRAELIRLEIQAIELELALQQARTGEIDSLVTWLQKNGTPWQEPHAKRSELDSPRTSRLRQNDVDETTSRLVAAASLFAATSLTETTSPNCQNPTPREENTAPREENTAPREENIEGKPIEDTNRRPSVNLGPKPRSQNRSYLNTSTAQTSATHDNIGSKAKSPTSIQTQSESKPIPNNHSVASKPKPTSTAKTAVPSQKSGTPKRQHAHPDKLPAKLESPKKQGLMAKAKNTPSWIVSTVVHAAILLILMLFTIPLPEPKEKLGLTGTFSPMTAAPLELESTTAPADQELISPDLTDPLPESTPLENVLEKSLPSASDIAGTTVAPTGLSESLASLSGSGSGTGESMLDGKFMDTLSSTQSLASANFFGLEATGNIFCFVVDCSGSMRGEPFTATKQELLKTISQLKPNQRFCVFFFSQKLFPMMLEEPIAQVAVSVEEEFRPTAVYATPENLMQLQRWMETVPIGAGGPPNQALKLAIELEPDSIFLLTDGVTRSDVAGNLTKTNRQEDELDGPQIRCPIHTIGFYSREGEALLQRIATENGGQYRYVPNPQPPKKPKKMAGGT